MLQKNEIQLLAEKVAASFDISQEIAVTHDAALSEVEV